MYGAMKRAVDLVGALALLLVSAPFLLLLCLAICLDSPGPAIFAQWRVGRGHKLFRMYKLRTMIPGAQKDARDIVEEEEIFAQRRDDPRVTRVGRVLRKLSLDELPQLLNVLKGEMSFVGPRPFVLPESNRLPVAALHRLDVRPGITGYAQAEGRSDADAVERLARDLYYVGHMDWWLDLRILWRTFSTVFHSEGSC